MSIDEIARIFSKSQEYEENMKRYEGNMMKYEEKSGRGVVESKDMKHDKSGDIQNVLTARRADCEISVRTRFCVKLYAQEIA